MKEYEIGLGCESGVRKIRKILANNIIDAKQIYSELYSEDKEDYETIDEVVSI